MRKSHVSTIESSACIFLYGTHKEIRMETREVVIFHHSRVKFVTLQELHANSMWSLIGDSNKICEHFENKCQVWVELYMEFN